ncbi:MAG: UDP-N-acetylglucosamine 1-carboxyvinyltransferase, partial [Hydrogenoanaerobacterium sp.]
MQSFFVKGGRAAGEVTVQGAKNSSLPVLAATLLCKGETILHKCPGLLDTQSAMQILEYLGCACGRSGSTVTVDSSDIK